MARVGLRSFAVAAATLALTVALPAAAAERPSVKITSVTVKRTKPDGRYAGTVNVRLRLCISVGPQAHWRVQERRTVGGRTKASARWNDPLGVDLTQIYPRECVSNYVIGWAVPTKLIRGAGTYAVTIRARDGYGKWSAPVGFSVKAGGP